jgi:hypothetical protein
MILKKRKPALLLTLGAAIALIAGGAVGYWLTTKRPQAGELPVGINVIPDDALMTLSFSTDEGQWRQLRTFGTPESQTVLDQLLVQLRDRLLVENGYNYQRDIKPWIGREMTVAFLPSDADSTASAEPMTATQPSEEPALPDAQIPGQLPEINTERTAVIVLPIADPVQAQQILTRRQEGEETLPAKDYKGVQIQPLKGDAEQPYAASVLDGRFLVIGTEEKVLEQVIDTYQGEASVTKTPGFLEAFRQVSDAQPFLQVYVNVPATRAIAAANSVQSAPSQNLAPLQNNQGLAATLSLQPEGVQIKGITWLHPESENRHRVTNQAERMPTFLPSDTLMMASGGNLQRLWEDYSQRPEANPSGILSPTALRQSVQNLTGLNLDEDLIPWMGGEFSLSLIANPESAANQGAGMLLMVQASDRRAADQTLQTLDNTVRDRYNFEIKEAEIAGKPVVNWVSPFASMTVTRGWLDGNVLFLAVGADVPNAILPAPTNSLAEQELFQQATLTELNPNNGHFFINLDRLMQANNNLPLPTLAPQQQAFLNAIRSIGVTTAIASDRTTRYDINVLLEKSGTPSPLPSPSLEASPSPEASPNAEESPASPEASPN